MQFQTLKTSVLILSAVSAVSAEFSRSLFTPPDFNVDVKDIFQPAPFRNMSQNLQTAGRRLSTGPMSEGCKAECPKAPDIMRQISALQGGGGPEEWTKAMTIEEMAFMCEPTLFETVKCIMKAKACQEHVGEYVPGDVHHVKNEYAIPWETVECSCACPGLAGMEKLKPADHCAEGSAMECISTKPECSAMLTKKILKGGSKADHDEGIRIMCDMVEEGCAEKSKKMKECDGYALKAWMGEEIGAHNDVNEANAKGFKDLTCEMAAKERSLATLGHLDSCCKAAVRLVECYSIECVELGMEYSINQAKKGSAAEKETHQSELTKNFHIGQQCPTSGIPKSKADLNSPNTNGATSDAWVSLPHAVPFVAMLSALYA